MGEGHLDGWEDLFGQGGERIDTHIFFPRHPYHFPTTPISPSCKIYPILRGNIFLVDLRSSPGMGLPRSSFALLSL